MSFLSDPGSVRPVQYVSVDGSFPLIREREWRSFCFHVATSCSAADLFKIYINLCFIQKKKSTSRMNVGNVFFLLDYHDACGVFDLEEF